MVSEEERQSAKEEADFMGDGASRGKLTAYTAVWVAGEKVEKESQAHQVVAKWNPQFV